MRGGNGDDRLRTSTGNVDFYNDGADQPRNEVDVALGVHRFDTTSSVEQRLFLDAATGAASAASFEVGPTDTDVPEDTGDVDRPTPQPRLISIDLPTVETVIGQSMTFSATLSDLPVDAVALLIWEVTDAEGEVIAQGSGATFAFVPPTSGTFDVSVSMTDDQHGIGNATTPVTIAASRVYTDPDDNTKQILVIGGTDGEDDIRLLDVRRQPNSVEVRIRQQFNNWTETTYTNISRIDVYGGDSDDDIVADRRLAIPVRLYGGNGDDRLIGGDGNDYLQGDAGEDRLYGNDGDNIIVGGWGSDRLDGGRDDDLMIGDELTPDAGKTDVDSLLARWSGSTDDVADRLSNLIADLSASVQGDGSKDRLDGDRGNDAFFSELSDRSRTRRRDDDVTHLF